MMMSTQLLFQRLATEAVALAQSTQETTFAGQPGTLLSNDKLQVTVMTQGGAIASVVLADDAKKQNPMWSGGASCPASTFTGILAHFVVVDSFGQPSAAERVAGLPQHGEAHTMKTPLTASKAERSSSLNLTEKLPIVREDFTWTFHVVPGENVVAVDSVLEELPGFDRQVSRAEHTTIQAAFVKPGVASLSVSGSRSQTRPKTIKLMVGPVADSTTPSPATQGGPGGGCQGRGGPSRLAKGVDFTSPMAPGAGSKQIDIRITPDNSQQGDRIATLLDPTRKLEWVATVNTEKGMTYGYLSRRQDYPWIERWGQCPSIDGLVRGREFSTHPYDIHKSNVIDAGPLFGTPT